MGPEVIRDPRFHGGHWLWCLTVGIGATAQTQILVRVWSAQECETITNVAQPWRVKGLQLLRFWAFALVGRRASIP